MKSNGEADGCPGLGGTGQREPWGFPRPAARRLAQTSGDSVPQVVDVGRKVAVDFDCPRLQHNADEREVPVVELRRLSGVDRVAELGLN